MMFMQKDALIAYDPFVLSLAIQRMGQVNQGGASMKLERVDAFAEQGRIVVAVPLGRDRPTRAPRRHIILPNETIDDYLIGTRQARPAELNGERRLRFVRENLEMILRRAVAICEAKLVIGHPSINGPRGNGLPDIIHIWRGEL